ncbi:hypothetical protein [Rhodopirellula baltica]|uniref:hypothetical protein n=1 Tax=Rhodopirellula baltica TaxID=265606 RepID=UPI001E34A4BC|nr:hypothetical protein [Rhodopirellula baltica]
MQVHHNLIRFPSRYWMALGPVVLAWASVGLQWGGHHSHPITPSTDSIPRQLESGIHASRLAELHSQLHSHGYAYPHDHGHSHGDGHPHSHDSSHSHVTDTTHIEGAIVGSQLHSHIRFFGIEFVVLATAEQHERHSVTTGLHERTKNMVLRVLMIRSPMPPTGDHFLRSNNSDLVLLANSLVKGCERAAPLVPPPQAT